eukprot:CAMPEP_0205907466 /NCGR_PEP_ID=MMETSP1325-20131115/2564_1 /ASSEMBLY_ACC=CAM_ASM_000708 /TAXON_ID=236786 /ORGANISM="Florenciella sp., Strain RCC1007" /LENGTH=264 /DNA_ID=CAMNT_0053273561 /DNA_START=62 /DNA_END=856 /DNA_ORIENTATION=-
MAGQMESLVCCGHEHEGSLESNPMKEEEEAKKRRNEFPCHNDGSNYAKRPGWDKIICPALAALYMNGDLLVDEEGFVTEADLAAAVKRTGLEGVMVSGVSNLSVPCPDTPAHLRKINLFKLDGSMLEHDCSTGIRDPAPDPDKFEKMATYADYSQDAEGRFYVKDLKKAITYFKANPNDRNLDSPDGGTAIILTYMGVLQVWGSDDEEGFRFISVPKLRALLLEGRYPRGWIPTAWSGFDILSKVIDYSTDGKCCHKKALCTIS